MNMHRLLLPTAIIAAALASFGCGGSADSGPSADTRVETGSPDLAGSDTSDVAAAPDDVSPPMLVCPLPGTSPLAAWVNTASGDLVASEPRVKDEAEDVLGTLGGVMLPTDLPEGATGDLPTEPVLRGLKSRTAPAKGLEGLPVAGEPVEVWRPRADGTWTRSGAHPTDADGRYAIDLSGEPTLSIGDNVAYAVLEGDGTCAVHHVLVLPAGTPVVVTDIDATLTTSDAEMIKQIADGDYDPELMGHAAELTTAWVAKGYVMIYLTARPRQFRAETRTWLDAHGFATGPVITCATLTTGEATRSYKSTWLSRVIDTLGWHVVAAYGNADTDLEAYADAGIPKAATFIIGPLAGQQGSVAIPDLDYGAHIAAYVQTQPDASAR